MARYALTRDSDGLVLNIAEWDGSQSWQPPSGQTVRLSAAAQSGDTWNGSTFVPRDASGDAAERLAEIRAQAITAITALQAQEMALRAVAETTRDEVNNLRQWLASFKAAAAGAGTFAAFKTAVAALPTMPDRTKVQMRTAIDNKITAGDADS